MSQEMMREGYGISTVNDKWLKFCLLTQYLESLTFYGNMTFFSFNDILNIVPISWFCRKNKIEKSDLCKNFNIFSIS